MAAKKVSRSKLIKKLDRIFSQYIRNRDSKDGICTCVTCGIQKPIKQTQAGHFMGRAKYSTRWNEENVHAQCQGCNLWKQGRQFEMGVYIDQKYYAGKADELLLLSNKVTKYADNEIIELIEHYKALNNE